VFQFYHLLPELSVVENVLLPAMVARSGLAYRRNRTALRDTELRGQKIREGDRLLLLYQSGNRDERVFDAPDVFDVERTPNPHVAFGGYGTHHCLGASLARLELRIMLEELLRRLPDLALATDAPLPRRASNFIVGIEEMPVRFTPTRPEGRGAV